MEDEQEESSSASENEENKAASSQDEGVPQVKTEIDSDSRSPDSPSAGAETESNDAHQPPIKTEAEDEDMGDAPSQTEQEPTEHAFNFQVKKEEAPSDDTDVLAGSWQPDTAHHPDEERLPEDIPEEHPATYTDASLSPKEGTEDSLDHFDDVTNQLEASIHTDADQAAQELMGDLIGLSTASPLQQEPASFSPAIAMDGESSQDSQQPKPMLLVDQTPTVVSSIDGNVELATPQQAAPTAPAGGVKIKINLFNKPAATNSPLPVPNSPPSDPILPDSSATDTAANTVAPEEPPVVPAPDDAALANKPRLVGRKLTVLPLMTKGTETSGLCSIM